MIMISESELAFSHNFSPSNGCILCSTMTKVVKNMGTCNIKVGMSQVGGNTHLFHLTFLKMYRESQGHTAVWRISELDTMYVSMY